MSYVVCTDLLPAWITWLARQSWRTVQLHLHINKQWVYTNIYIYIYIHIHIHIHIHIYRLHGQAINASDRDKTQHFLVSHSVHNSSNRSMSQTIYIYIYIYVHMIMILIMITTIMIMIIMLLLLLLITTTTTTTNNNNNTTNMNIVGWPSSRPLTRGQPLCRPSRCLRISTAVPNLRARLNELVSCFCSLYVHVLR